MVQRPFSNLQSIAFRNGHPDAHSDIIVAGPVSPGSGSLVTSAGRWLVATVEPVEGTEYAWSVAAKALDALRQGFAVHYDAAIPQALARGFAAANACVRHANSGEHGRRRSERVGIGASAIAVDGEQIVLAHVPPSQIVFTQDRLIYSIPALHSWEPHYAGSDRSDAEPLGAREQIVLDIFRTTIAPRDTFVLCSTSLGRAIAELPDLRERLQPPADPDGRPLTSLPVGPAEHPVTMLDIGPVRPTEFDLAGGWVDWLAHVAGESRVTACHAVVATIGQVHDRGQSRSFRQRLTSDRTAGRPVPVTDR